MAKIIEKVDLGLPGIKFLCYVLLKEGRKCDVILIDMSNRVLRNNRKKS
jgi:hypothetical protein